MQVRGVRAAGAGAGADAGAGAGARAGVGRPHVAKQHRPQQLYGHPLSRRLATARDESEGGGEGEDEDTGAGAGAGAGAGTGAKLLTCAIRTLRRRRSSYM